MSKTKWAHCMLEAARLAKALRRWPVTLGVPAQSVFNWVKVEQGGELGVWRDSGAVLKQA
ncbi:hypothetical protein IHE33_09685 [Mycetohabitans endofungorum]|uniref:hypothetical protein n=1 Tax=Mycetohabitans endofungorum TaxID=417203 RepID=UPI0030CDBF66